MFTTPPIVEFLQRLTPGSLKQSLARAVRLWVYLRFLYGEESELGLPEWFSYPEWRDAFFTASHPKSDANPKGHDSQCRCAKTMGVWLFENAEDGEKQRWIRSLEQCRCCPDDLVQQLENPLLAVTRRTLVDDFKGLVQCQFLQQDGNRYRRSDHLPAVAEPISVISSSAIAHVDLAAIADNLTQPLNGYQRFFLHVDYVVPVDAVDRVDEWQARLRSIWEASVIVPIKLQYWSSKQRQQEHWVVYPVCVYYVQRATYLCSWGINLEESDRLVWHNFRLHSIQDLYPLTWGDKSVPKELRDAQKRGLLPTPDEIQERMAEAWGFDFYQPKRLMILRFERWFDEGYVRNTVRHETFQPIAYETAEVLIRKEVVDQEQRKELLKVLVQRSPQDAYYQAWYREGDPNVTLRLRAWRPKLEVLIPWGLRQQMIEEVMKEFSLYHGEQAHLD